MSRTYPSRISYSEITKFNDDCCNGDINSVKKFIEDNSKKSDYTYIRLGGFKFASSHGHVEVLKLLIENGETSYNSGALCACENNNMKSLEFLINKGADMLGNCIEFACSYNNYEMVKLLLEHEKRDFVAGLIASCKKGNMEIFKLFFNVKKNKKIIKYNLVDKGEAACTACKYGHIEIVKYLLELDVKIYSKLFNIACLYGHYELVRLLFSDKINVDNGLENACVKKNNDKVIDFLIDKGIDDYDESFKIAVKHNNVSNAKLLLSKGVNNLNDALFIVCNSRLQHDYTEIINILIDNGADNVAQVIKLTYHNRNHTSFEALVDNMCKY